MSFRAGTGAGRGLPGTRVRAYRGGVTVEAERTRLSWERYVALPEDGSRSEFVDGTVHVTPLAGARHQTFVSRTAFLLAGVFGADRVLPGHHWLLRDGLLRIPDVSVLPGPQSDAYVTVPPQIVVEVLSATTPATDELNKTVEYAIYGAGTYWLIDPDVPSLTVLHRAHEAWDTPVVLRRGAGVVRIDTPAGPVDVDVEALLA